MAKNSAQTLRAKTGTMSIGKKTAKLGLKIDRAELPLGKMDALMTDARVNILLEIDEEEDGQQIIEQTKPGPFTGIADTKTLGVTSDGYTSGLTFNLKELNTTHLGKFHHANVVLSVDKIGSSLPPGGAAERDNEDGEGDED